MDDLKPTPLLDSQSSYVSRLFSEETASHLYKLTEEDFLGILHSSPNDLCYLAENTANAEVDIPNFQETESVDTLELRNWCDQNQIECMNKEKMPYLPQAQPSVFVDMKCSNIPNTSNFPGPYGFKVVFTESKDHAVKKAISYTYSAVQHKLYVRIETVCPFQINLTTQPPLPSSIRATVVFLKPDDAKNVVKRCANHASKDSGHPYANHLVQCVDNRVIYHEDPQTGRYSVTVPYEPPNPGMEFSLVHFQFMCFSSCAGGINRRPIMLVLTLEHNEQILARQSVELRVCACPGRDKQSDEAQRSSIDSRESERKTSAKDNTVSKRCTTVQTGGENSTGNEGCKLYTIQVQDRELYKVLTTVVRAFEIRRNLKEMAMLKILPKTTFDSNTPVLEWLQSLNVVHYGSVFNENGYCKMADLESLTSEDLKRMGVSSVDLDRIYSSFLHWRLYNNLATSQFSSLATPTPPMR